MEHKCLNILLVILLFFINSVYNRPKSNELKHQQGDISEMVKSDRVVEAANEDFMNIEGMEKRAGEISIRSSCDDSSAAQLRSDHRELR